MEKPILFNTEMVQAILKGRKTVTRRIIRDIDDNYGYLGLSKYECCHKDDNTAVFYRKTTSLKLRKKMPCKVGDILYVRETWCDTSKDMLSSCDLDLGECKYIFKVDDDGKSQPLVECEVKRWRPSIHMQKEAARIFLEVTDVRVERLQDITEDEAIKEGIRAYTKDGKVFKYAANEEQYKWSEMPRNPIDAFKKLWDSCYNWPKCWTYNPWVWVIEFKVKEIKL